MMVFFSLMVVYGLGGGDVGGGKLWSLGGGTYYE